MKKTAFITLLLLLSVGVMQLWAQLSAPEPSMPTAPAGELATPVTSVASEAAAEVTPTKPAKGKFYYISCATYQNSQFVLRYLYVDASGALKTTTKLEKANVNFQWKCDTTAEGKYSFANGSGKYLAHKTVADAVHNFNLKDKGAGTYTGAFALETENAYGSQARYMCLKNDGSKFDHISETWNQQSKDYASDFVFEEVTINTPVNGKIYYISCATWNGSKFVQQYLYDDGSKLTYSTKCDSLNVNYQWKCTVTTDGKYNFQNGSGKYLGFNQTQATAYNYEVRDKGNGQYFNAVSLYAVGNSRYICIKNDGTEFNYLGETWNQKNKSHASDFVFGEVLTVPSVGETCYIYAVTWDGSKFVNRYLYYTGSGLATSTVCERKNVNYQWTCERSGSGLAFKNGSGKYLKHRGIQDTAYEFTVNPSSDNFNAATFQSTVDGVLKYFLTNNNGQSFDQGNSPYKPTSTSWTSDYRFETVDATYATTLLVTSNIAQVNAKITWNGETKACPAAFEFGENATITDSTLTATTGNLAYKFEKFTEGDKDLTTNAVGTLTKDRAIVAHFAPDIFSTNYGEKWIRVNMSNGRGYAMNLPKATSYENQAPNTAVRDLTAESQLWCFVGTSTSFKIYNKVSGKDYVLATEGTSYGNGTITKMVSATSADATNTTNWMLVNGLQHAVPGFCISPVGNSTWGLNPHGGVGNNLKFYSNGDQGNQWYFELAPKNPLTIAIEQTGKSAKSNTILGGIDITINGVKSEVLLHVDSLKHDIILPAGATYSISQSAKSYHGYIFKGFKVDGKTVDAINDTILTEDGVTITAMYEENAEDKAQHMFYVSDSSSPFRIPAITRNGDGSLTLFTDHRPCGSDIGYGDVDIIRRYSTDNGATWSEPLTVLNGTGKSGALDCGFGDAAVVGDANSMNLLLVCVAGNKPWATADYSTGNPMPVVRMVSTDGGKTWPAFDAAKHNITDSIYGLFKNSTTPVKKLFFGSGRIMQSRKVKVGNYYRLYAALCANPGGNRVIYSDDFGQTWKALGGANAMPAPAGDEPKCEELLDGSVVLSSRKSYGRYFNVYKYTNQTTGEGSWGDVVASNSATNGISFGSNSTNGEIMLVECTAKTSPLTRAVPETKYLMLQSVPTGGDRSGVTIYYKEISNQSYTSADFASGWTKGLTVCEGRSAYSTMAFQADGNIGFFYEEANGDVFTMVYRPLTLEEITSDQYTTENYVFTSINEVGADSAPSVNGIFDLNGRRLEKITEDGIYIVNGKKVMVRVK